MNPCTESHIPALQSNEISQASGATLYVLVYFSSVVHMYYLVCLKGYYDILIPGIYLSLTIVYFLWSGCEPCWLKKKLFIFLLCRWWTGEDWRLYGKYGQLSSRSCLRKWPALRLSNSGSFISLTCKAIQSQNTASNSKNVVISMLGC